MVDIVDKATRSKMMSGIRGKNTKPELLIRKALHNRGFRYRLHSANLPGKPDLVFPRYNAVLFVHGCFWHGHNCKLFKLPATHTEFWQEKISANKIRDFRQLDELHAKGWRTIVVWECTTRGVSAALFDKLIDRIASWLTLEKNSIHIDLNEPHV